MEILTVNNLSFTYPQSTKAAIQHISFGIEKGTVTAICGATGSGKSTLLRLLKRELTPLGKKSGTISFMGTALEQLDAKTSAWAIGYVMQKPEQQIVTDKVWHELVFGLENINLPQKAIRRRVAEMSSYFGIEDWFDKNVSELSGGQKQLLNLAAVMVMQPELLILDEPTAQLDPVAASDFLDTIYRLNRETALTVLMVEHRLENVIPLCDKLLVLDSGELLFAGKPLQVCQKLQAYPELLQAMPAAVRLYNSLDIEGECPLTVRQGRSWLEANFPNKIRSLSTNEYRPSQIPALELHNVWFRYARDLPDILQATELTIYQQEIFCILGGNGSGKTTALNIIAGLLRPYSGSIRIFGRKIGDYKNQTLYKDCLSLLPQDVQTVFLHNTVREELAEAGSTLEELPYNLSGLMDKHPYDLSGGEQQLAALAKVLAGKPRLLLLDEPTKGIDPHARQGIAAVLQKLRSDGMTIVAVTHDVEFAASCADRCALFFRGEVTAVDTPQQFFAENSFYTTAINRITRDYYDRIVTLQEAVEICRRNKGEL